MKIDTDTEEGKAELQKLIDKETDGLKAKNSELLGDIKKMKADLKDMKDQQEKLAQEREEAERVALEKSGDVEKIKKSIQDKYEKDIADLKNKISDKDGTLHKLLVDQGLSDALVKAGVVPQYLDAVKALIKTSNTTEISEQDGDAVAMIDGKPIADFVSGWAQGEHGKHYIAAPRNGGGGAGGSGGGGKAPDGQKRSAMSHVQKAEFIKEHGQDAYLALPQ